MLTRFLSVEIIFIISPVLIKSITFFPSCRQHDESDDEMEYDEEGNPIIVKKSKIIDPLPPIDHSTINYSDFTKNFYQEHEDIASLDHLQVNELRRKLGISVSGAHLIITIIIIGLL